MNEETNDVVAVINTDNEVKSIQYEWSLWMSGLWIMDDGCCFIEIITHIIIINNVFITYVNTLAHFLY